MKWKKQRRKKSVRQLFLVVGRNDDHWAVLRLDCLACLVDEELHSIELDEKIIGELDVCFVDFVNEQYHLFIGIKCLPELTSLDVIGDVMHTFITQLRITKPRHSIVLIQTLLSFRR